MVVKVDFLVRTARFTDQQQIAGLIHSEKYVHRHLDWRNPLDWLGFPPYLVAEMDGRAVAALACPPDPPQVAWIRLFASSSYLPPQESWQWLWQAARAELGKQGIVTVAVIALRSWFENILRASGFVSRQQILVLEWVGGPFRACALPPGISIRLMETEDLPAVAEVDAAAFAPLWQNSQAALSRAYAQAVLMTVAESEQGILGYQLSTPNPFGGHLARLAVWPEAQGRGVASALVGDLIQQLARRGLYRLTVNTQNDNVASLTLYRRLGFRQTGERYPVFEFWM